MKNINKKGQFIETTGMGLYKRKIRNGKNHQAHRLIWEEHYGEIPAGDIVHHINGDKKDNRIENLKAMSLTEHNQMHKHPAWNIGIPLTVETKMKIHNKRNKTIGFRALMTYVLKGRGLTAKEVADIQEMSDRNVWDRLKIAEKMMKELTISELEELSKKRQVVECYSRIVGYIRPVDGWNPGKAEEFKDRKMFNVTD